MVLNRLDLAVMLWSFGFGIVVGAFIGQTAMAKAMMIKIKGLNEWMK